MSDVFLPEVSLRGVPPSKPAIRVGFMVDIVALRKKGLFFPSQPFISGTRVCSAGPTSIGHPLIKQIVNSD